MNFKTLKARILRSVATTDREAVTAVLDDAEEELKEKPKDGKGKDAAGAEPGAAPEVHTHVHLPGEGGGTGETEDGMTKAVKDRFKSIDTRFGKIEDGIQRIARGFDALPENFKKKGEGEGEETEDEVTPPTGNERGRGILGNLEFTAPPGTNDRQRQQQTRRTVDAQVTDSLDLEEDFAELVARAEIIVPGVRMPTFDAKIPAARTADRMCSFRRRVLDHVLRDEEAVEDHETLDLLSGGKAPSLAKMTCDAVSAAFNGLAEFKRRAQNIELSDGAGHLRGADAARPAGNGRRASDRAGGGSNGAAVTLRTPAEINAAQAAFWRNRTAAEPAK